jgi:hypothetical protein
MLVTELWRVNGLFLKVGLAKHHLIEHSMLSEEEVADLFISLQLIAIAFIRIHLLQWIDGRVDNTYFHTVI